MNFEQLILLLSIDVGKNTKNYAELKIKKKKKTLKQTRNKEKLPLKLGKFSGSFDVTRVPRPTAKLFFLFILQFLIVVLFYYLYYNIQLYIGNEMLISSY
jgi:hypothetical protein